MQSSRVEADSSAGSRHRDLKMNARTEFVTEKNADPGGACGEPGYGLDSGRFP